MEDTLILNRYRLLETKAHGGFSTVQIAWDTRVQRRVAIKSIPLEQDGPSLLTPGLEEARTAALLSNPSIVVCQDE
jgi:serine/threonine protein kinase